MLKQKQTGSVKIVLVLAVVLIAVVLIGRHLSSHAADAQSALAAAEASTAVQKPASATVPESNRCASNAKAKMVIVSISTQRMWACRGSEVANQSAVTTGASNAPNGLHDGTPIGIWHVYEKFRNLHLKGKDRNGPWDDYVQYWMPFDSAVGFHDASWQTFPFGSPQYKTGGSHGCVQLPTAMAAWLYAWAPVGTEVVVKA